MSDLKITEVVIEDSLGQLAKTCTLTLVAMTAEGDAVAELGGIGSAAVASILPNGSVIDIVGTYGGSLSHVLFKGAIEYMDDLNDPDKLSYKMILSQTPRGFPHKQRRSSIWNMTEHGEDVGSASVSSVGVLSSLCSMAGISLGRCDIPSYSIWGTYEVHNQTPVEVAQSLAAPFNQGENEKYYVRADTNGLQVIRVDYSHAGRNNYEIAHVTRRKTNYQQFVPSISDGDILLTGGEKYGTQRDVVAKWTGSISQEYSAYSREGDRSVSRHTTYIFHLEITVEDSALEGGLDLPRFPTAGDSIWWVLEQAELGLYSTVTILDSLPVHSFETTTSAVVGLISTEETWTNFEERSFTGSGLAPALTNSTKWVQTDSTMIRCVGVSRGTWPTKMTKTWYYYWDTGDSRGSAQSDYYYAYSGNWTSWLYGYPQTMPGVYKWYFQKSSVTFADGAAATNAEIQMALNGWNEFNNPGEPPLPPNGAVYKSAQVPVLTYRTLNGTPLLPAQLPKKKTRNTSVILSAEYLDSLGKMRGAQSISCPGMDYGGLSLVLNAVRKTQNFSAGRWCWQNRTIDCVLDTTPVVGENINYQGVTGICESFKHTINEDSATTEITTRSLINA